MAAEIGDTFAYVGSYTVENAVRDRFVTNAKGIEVFRVRGKDGVWSMCRRWNSSTLCIYCFAGNGRCSMLPAVTPIWCMPTG